MTCETYAITTFHIPCHSPFPQANAELEQETTDLRQVLAEREEELNALRADFEELEVPRFHKVYQRAR